MGDAKHTPGPWEIEPREEIGGFVINLAGQDELPVAIAPMNKRGNAIAEANARLIAAAPEMLAALKAAETAINNCLTWKSHLSHIELATVQAAIAKAES